MVIVAFLVSFLHVRNGVWRGFFDGGAEGGAEKVHRKAEELWLPSPNSSGAGKPSAAGDGLAVKKGEALILCGLLS